MEGDKIMLAKVPRKNEVKRVKITKQMMMPLLVLVFVALGLESLVLPYVPFGSGRWSDSLGTNVSNHAARINGNLNVTGNYYKNGVLFTGGGGSDVDFDTIYSVGKDSTKFLTLRNRNSTYTGSNTFNNTTTFDQVYITGNLINDGLSQTDTLRITNGINVGGPGTISGRLILQSIAIFQAGLQIADATKVIINSGNDILYQVTTGGAHIMETQSGTDLMKVDSANGTQLKVPGMSSSSYLGSNPLLSFKVVTVPFSTSAATMTSTAHGLTNNKILAYTVAARIDTTTISTINSANDMLILPGYSQIGQLLYSATVDSLSCNVRTLGSPNSLSLQGDTARFILFYVQ
jgi:hypothetical protein